MRTISLKNASGTTKTIVEPTRMDVMGASTSSVFTPISGQAVVQTSNNRDSYGPKNSIRTMTWDAISITPINAAWTMTLLELKATEGLANVLTATNSFGYTSAQNIVVTSVEMEWVERSDGLDWFTVNLSYFHT